MITRSGKFPRLQITILITVCCSLLTSSAYAISQIITHPVPPPAPRVAPLIMRPVDLDKDGNGIDDRLEAKLNGIKARMSSAASPAEKAKIEAGLSEPVRVELIFSHPITQDQINGFVNLGGQIEYVFQAVSYGWIAHLPLKAVEALSARMGSSFVAVAAESPVKLHMDEATRTGRVRPVWTSGFAGYPSGFSGNTSTTIAIIDTGVDESHTDLNGRLEYWKDWTSDLETSPRDIIQHGTHVAGIACGTGAAAGANTNTLYYTDSGDLTGVASGNFYPSPIHIPAGLSVAFSSTATWLGGGSTTFYILQRANGTTSYGSLASATGSSPVSKSASFTSSSSYGYSAGLTQSTNRSINQYAITNTVTYAGVGDGFNTLRGVAPGCRWAGLKVFKNDGTGSSLDIGEAVDDIIVQRIAHNIKVVNMSLGINGSPGTDTTLRGKVNTMVNNGVIAVVSAGNDGPGTAGSNQIDDPGRAALAITVAASNDINQLTQYTSSGFSSPGTTEDYKPDVMAPGGSQYYSAILAPDSNDADAESASFPDQRANDYMNIMGTSMSSPFTAGAAALVVQALESTGVTWNYSSSTQPLLVKMLLCATCTESNAPREANTGTNPTLGRAAAPKDLYEGYGMINPDASIEAVTTSYQGDQISGSTNGGVFDRRAWARKVNLSAGGNINVALGVPATADFDLYLYSGVPDSKGNPVIRTSSTNAGNGMGESINYTASSSETVYLVIKRVSGSGTWTLQNPYAAVNLAQAKTLADNSQLTLSGQTITAAFTDYFYVEDDARSCGIRVDKTAHGLTVGMRADISGTILTNTDGERYILAAGASANGTGTIAPLGLNNKSLGGGDWSVSGSGAGQKGVLGGQGVNNIGLLVRTCGRIMSSDSTGFYIEDGSALTPQVKVLVPSGTPTPPTGKYVMVTGVSSCYKIGNDLYRQVRVRNGQDIQTTK